MDGGPRTLTVPTDPWQPILGFPSGQEQKSWLGVLNMKETANEAFCSMELNIFTANHCTSNCCSPTGLVPRLAILSNSQMKAFFIFILPKVKSNTGFGEEVSLCISATHSNLPVSWFTQRSKKMKNLNRTSALYPGSRAP